MIIFLLIYLICAVLIYGLFLANLCVYADCADWQDILASACCAIFWPITLPWLILDGTYQYHGFKFW